MFRETGSQSEYSDGGVHLALQKYRKHKPKQFRLGIAAPVPQYFVEVCTRFELPLDEKYITGGIYVDGERVEDGVVDDVGGRWLLSDTVSSDVP